MKRPVLKSLVPKSLAGQMIALLLLALVAAQLVSLVVLSDERHLAALSVAHEHILARSAGMARLLRQTPAEMHGRIVAAARTPRLHFELAPEDAVPAGRNAVERDLEKQLMGLLDGAVSEVHVAARERHGWFGWQRHWRDDDAVNWAGRRHRRGPPWWRQGRFLGLTLALRLDENTWLNVATLVPPRPPGWALPSLLSLGLMALLLVVVVIVMVRRVTRPLARLAAASDQLGRGQETAALPERGPRDVRRTIAAFNRMNQRLQRYVSDRTNMLAAISHDLRTPITSLRLRAEFVEDAETRERMIATLDEMQQMAEATLDFAREEAAREHTRPVNLVALLQSLCDDLVELGQEVSFQDTKAPTPAVLACRPVALKRALRNLIENAVRYGQRARLALRTGEEGFRIDIDDDGPGIAAEALERVFEPFVRLEESRSPETGGIGLGLAIARSIARGHGGDIALTTRDEGGLRASVSLPRGAA